MSFTVEQRSQNVLAVRFFNIESGWKQRILLRACAHWDHPHSDRQMQKSHLDEALLTGSPVFDFGDLFCAMQSKKDPRHDKEAVREEHQKNAHLNALIETAVKWHAPYAPVWALFGYGNHETGMLKHREYDLTMELARRMQVEHGCIGYTGAYYGWVQLMFTLNGSHRLQKVLYYTHGRGGDSPVTFGTAKATRRAVYLPDADIVVAAHTHGEFRVPIPRKRINSHGKVYEDRQLHIQVPSYKQSLLKDPLGFEANHDMAPKPHGAFWLTLECKGNDIKIDAVKAE